MEEQLIRSILDGTFPPGTPLPPERELAARLGVSRPTLREALQRMARDGWIVTRGGRPPVVSDFWSHGNLNVLAWLAGQAELLPSDFVTRLLEVRAALMPPFGRAAVERHPAKVVAFVSAFEDLDDEPAAFVAFDWELQRRLATLSGNYVLSLMLNGFAALYERAARQYFARPESRAASRRFYRRLLEAAMAADARRAGEVLADAMQESIRLWQETFSRHAADAEPTGEGPAGAQPG